MRKNMSLNGLTPAGGTDTRTVSVRVAGALFPQVNDELVNVALASTSLQMPVELLWPVDENDARIESTTGVAPALLVTLAKPYVASRETFTALIPTCVSASAPPV